MSDKEILTKALQKAGIPYSGFASYIYGYVQIFSHDFAKSFWGEETIDDFGHIIINNNDEESEMFPFTNQEESAYYREQDVAIMQKSWQYHLQQMVLEENPLKYLSKFLD